MMRDVGAHLCDPNCRAYHRAWGYLRLYGVLPAVGRDHDVLLSTFRAQIRAGRRRVLVSGAADAGILAYLIESFRAEGTSGRIAVIDRCPTPLAANTWYAAQNDWSIDIWCGSIQDYVGSGFDLVVSHNFLNSIAVEDRPAVCASWHNALEPGGQAVLIGDIKPDEGAFGRRFDPDQVKELVDDILRAQAGSDDRDLISPDDLESIVTAFAETRQSYKLRSQSEFIDPIEAAGLRILETEDIDASLPASLASPHNRRICVIAERPG